MKCVVCGKEIDEGYERICDSCKATIMHSEDIPPSF